MILHLANIWSHGTAARRVHLITRAFMLGHTPPMITLTDDIRLMYRSRHPYILAGGVANLLLFVLEYLSRRLETPASISGHGFIRDRTNSSHPDILHGAIAWLNRRHLAKLLRIVCLFGGGVAHFLSAATRRAGEF